MIIIIRRNLISTLIKSTYDYHTSVITCMHHQACGLNILCNQLSIILRHEWKNLVSCMQ